MRLNFFVTTSFDDASLTIKISLHWIYAAYISFMTNSNFDDILNKKGSSGSIKFNHNEKTLDLIVQKDNKDEHSKTADVKALSGGERSFTTLALLLALGECLETPFRVMGKYTLDLF